LLESALGEDVDQEASVAQDESPLLALPAPSVRRFGDYELLEEIARGGMGVVYKARQVSLNRVVAVKMILSPHFATAKSVQRYRAEAEAAANLHHPNIVAIHEFGNTSQPFFSMDYVEAGASRT
jgi:serine/threonine-protein kinase